VEVVSWFASGPVARGSTAVSLGNGRGDEEGPLTSILDGPWEAYLTRSQFTVLREDACFRRILTLGRIVNSIRFVEGAIVAVRGRMDGASVRQRVSGMLYLSALLQEALAFSVRIGKDFRDWPSYRDKLAPLLSDPATRMLRANALDRLRDQAVYHHDDIVVDESVSEMVADEYVLMSGLGRLRGEAYYDFSDLIVVHYAIRPSGDPAAIIAASSQFFPQITRLAVRFAAAADELVAEAFQRFKVRYREAVA
jgi:hypothetical protein